MLAFLLTVELLGFAVWPLAHRLFRKLPDSGWAFSKVIGVLITMWFAWMLSRAKLVSFSHGHSLVIACALACVCWGVQAFLADGGIKKLFSLKRNWFIIIGELLFIVGFIAWSALRAMKPELIDLEKFMDYGFMLSALKTRYFPPLDHFLAGETINYYYMGHAIGALLTQLSGVEPGVGYNLQMSNLFALGLSEAFSIGAGLYWLVSRDALETLGKRSIVAGLLSAAFVMVLGNLHMLYYLPLQGGYYWFPDATRYIPGTIHEYPIYSFLVNDLHGHVSNIPIVILALALALMTFLLHATDKVAWRSKEAVLLLLATTFVLGACYVVSAWDLAVYLLCFGLVYWTVFSMDEQGLASRLFKPEVLARTAVVSVLLVAGSVLFWFPQWIDMKPPAQGIGIVSMDMRPSPHRFVLVWGLQGFFTLALFYYRGRRQAQLKFLEILGLTSATLIVIPELIYVKDIYTTQPRSNTVFKLYYAAWIMLGITSGYATVLLWTGLRSVKPRLAVAYKIVAVLLIGGAALYPAKGCYQFILSTVDLRRGLDGTGFLYTKLPGDAQAIKWLNENAAGQPVIAEGVGESYSLHARVATFTGFQAVLGWPVHEWLWRGSLDKPMRPISNLQKKTGQEDTVNSRRADVKTLFETDKADEAKRIIEKYDIEYVYIGMLERKLYAGLNEAKFPELGRLVYADGGVKIFQVR